MAVNKVEYNDNGQLKTLIDLTADTVTADKLAKGYTAHDMSGNIITGTMESGSGDNTLLKSVIEGSVTEITIPDGTTKIIPNIFRQNPKLKKVVIPGTVKEIGNYAFAYNKLISVFENSIIDPQSAFCFGCDYRVPMMHGLISRAYVNNLKTFLSFLLYT